VTGLPDEEDSAVRRDVDRVVAFSDGVFAIAITLLVLSIDVPNVPDRRLGDALENLIPFVFTYALSFLIVGLYWLAHHRLFRTLERVTRTLLFLNLLVLGIVALLPFPTELLGRYGNTTLGTVVYAAAMTLAGASMVLLSWYVRHADLAPTTSEAQVHLAVWRGAIPPIVFAASIPVAFVDETLAKLVWIAIWPCNMVLESRYGKDAYGTVGE
jgi:uncharacterized membrane protein